MGKSNLKWEELESKVANTTNADDEIYESQEIPEETINTKENSKKKKIKSGNIEEVKEQKRKIIPIIVIGIIFVAIIIFSTIFALININNTNIVSGVKINGIDVAGLSREEAKEKIDSIYNEKKQKDILLKYEDYDATINP